MVEECISTPSAREHEQGLQELMDYVMRVLPVKAETRIVVGLGNYVGSSAILPFLYEYLGLGSSMAKLGREHTNVGAPSEEMKEFSAKLLALTLRISSHCGVTARDMLQRIDKLEVHVILDMLAVLEEKDPERETP